MTKLPWRRELLFVFFVIACYLFLHPDDFSQTLVQCRLGVGDIGPTLKRLCPGYDFVLWMIDHVDAYSNKTKIKVLFLFYIVLQILSKLIWGVKPMLEWPFNLQVI